jgi:hypothetical protein
VKHFVLDYTYEDDSGLWGWSLPGVPSFFTPMQGVGVAHDVLEHVKLGTIQDEAMAFGAMLWGRGSGGYWSDQQVYTEWQTQVGNDLARFVCMAREVPARPRTRRLHAELEEQIAVAYADVLRLLPDEEESYSKPHADAVRDTTRYMDWIRHGYRVAARRFGHHMRPFQFCDLFRKIQNHREVAEPSRYVESELDKLHIQVCLKARSVKIWLEHYQDPYA